MNEETRDALRREYLSLEAAPAKEAPAAVKEALSEKDLLRYEYLTLSF